MHLFFSLLFISHLFVVSLFGGICPTEGDSAAIVDHQVHLATGELFQVVTDMVVGEEFPLVVQRHFSNRNYVTGEGEGGWRIFPECWLLVGKTTAYSGEPSGSILKFHSIKKGIFQVDLKGVANTSKGRVGAQFDLKNHRLQKQGAQYILSTSGGMRIYEPVECLPAKHFGEELSERFLSLLKNPASYRLVREVYKEGCEKRFDYDADGHLASVRLVDERGLLLASIECTHHEGGMELIASDGQRVRYLLHHSLIQEVQYSESATISYTYDSEGRMAGSFIPGREVYFSYDALGRVIFLSDTGKKILYSEEGATVLHPLGERDVYTFDTSGRVIQIEHYNEEQMLSRVDRRVWEGHRLQGMTIEDGFGYLVEACTFNYDVLGNLPKLTPKKMRLKTLGPEVDQITFMDNFEDNHKNKSCIYDLSDYDGFQELKRGRILLINGVNNSFDNAVETAKYLGQLSGGYNIHGVYNATHGFFVDAHEYFLNSNFIATPPVRKLHKQWDLFFEKADKETPLLQICHSQGSVLVRNALMCYSKDLRERIIVVAIAPSSYIHKNLCKEVTHYVTNWMRDLVPWLDLSGRKENEENITVLVPAEGAPLLDHGLCSPTYKLALLYEMQNYIAEWEGH